MRLTIRTIEDFKNDPTVKVLDNRIKKTDHYYDYYMTSSMINLCGQTFEFEERSSNKVKMYRMMKGPLSMNLGWCDWMFKEFQHNRNGANS